MIGELAAPSRENDEPAGFGWQGRVALSTSPDNAESTPEPQGLK